MHNLQSPDNFSPKMINDNNDILIVLLPGTGVAIIEVGTPRSLKILLAPYRAEIIH